MKVGLIGCGAIGKLLVQLLPRELAGVEVTAVLAHAAHHEKLVPLLGHATCLVSSVQDLLATPLDLVIECAGHEALRECGPIVLESGMDLLVASVGALADPLLESSLMTAAATGRSRIHIPGGALAGLDALSAASYAGLKQVTYRSSKGIDAWKGSPAESMVDLASLRSPAVFFKGSARDASRLFPQNANVAAAIAMAGIGFDSTVVSLTADPDAQRNTHFIDASGAFGEVSIRIQGLPLPDNPKTSTLVPYSIVRSVANLSQSVAIA